MDDAFASAVALHQAGSLVDAGRLYRQILIREPDHPDALHLLGVLHHQQGDHGKAIEFIGRAVALQPSTATFHANLAEAYRATLQFDRAVGCCRAALRLSPEYPEALSNLGLALQGLGRHTEAAQQFRRAVELQPAFAPAHNNLGRALQQAGRADEALVHFRRAVELSPDLASAQTNLGQLLLERGDLEEALAHSQEAVRLQPDRAALHHNLGNVLRTMEQFVSARAAFLEALRLDPDLAVAHAQLGLVLHREGRLDEALPWLKQAMELEPENAAFWQQLGQLHQDNGATAEAVRCFERACELSPENADARVSVGWALQEEGRLTEAGEHFRIALTMRPNYALVHMNLGGLHEELGEMRQTETYFREAIRLQPSYALPHGRLATLLRGKLPAADRTALEAHLADPRLAKEPRARLLFARAHVLDAGGEYPAAAECLREANALTLGLALGKRAYSPPEHERFVTDITGAFNADFFARTTGAGLDTRRPVFVFGLPRSGTTLIEQVLAGHPQVHGAGELRFGMRSFEALPAPASKSNPPLPGLPHIDAPTVRRLAEQHLGWLGAVNGQADRVVDKMPDNYIYLGLLAAMFPRATFIHCRRDLRDIAVSCWMTDFRGIRWANDLGHIASRFTQYRHLMDHWRSVVPVPLIEVEYKETVTDLEGVARRLLAACDLEWNPICLDFHRLDRPIRTASATQVRQPVYTKSLARWKHYERELVELFSALPADS